jgi:hypothetical protein
LIGGTQLTSARPEWLGSKDPAPATRRGFYLRWPYAEAALGTIQAYDDRISAQAGTGFDGAIGSAGIARYAFGTARLNGGLFRHGNRNRIPAICRGMPPHGTRDQGRAPPWNFGGYGTGVGETRQGGRPRTVSRLALTAFLLLLVKLPLGRKAQPHLRHLQQGGSRFGILAGAGYFQALRGVAPILV